MSLCKICSCPFVVFPVLPSPLKGQHRTSSDGLDWRQASRMCGAGRELTGGSVRSYKWGTNKNVSGVQKPLKWCENE